MLITNIEIGTINGEVAEVAINGDQQPVACGSLRDRTPRWTMAEANDDTNMIVIEYPSQSE